MGNDLSRKRRGVLFDSWQFLGGSDISFFFSRLQTYFELYLCNFSYTHYSSYSCLALLPCPELFYLGVSTFLDFSLRQGKRSPSGQDLSLSSSSATVLMAIQNCCFLRTNPFSFLQMTSMASSTLFSRQRVRAFRANQISAISSKRKLIKFLLLVLLISSLQVWTLALRRVARLRWQLSRSDGVMRIFTCARMTKQQTREFWQASNSLSNSSRSRQVQSLQRSLRATHMNFLWELLVDRLYFSFRWLMRRIFSSRPAPNSMLLIPRLIFYIYIVIESVRTYQLLSTQHQTGIPPRPLDPLTKRGAKPVPPPAWLIGRGKKIIIVEQGGLQLLQQKLIANQFTSGEEKAEGGWLCRLGQIVAAWVISFHQFWEETYDAWMMGWCYYIGFADGGKEQRDSFILGWHGRAFLCTLGGKSMFLCLNIFCIEDDAINSQLTYRQFMALIGAQILYYTITIPKGVQNGSEGRVVADGRGGGRWGMCGMTVYKSGISAAFFLWFFVIDGLLLEGEAFKGGLQFLLPLQDLGHELVEGTSGTLECFGAGLNVDDAYLFCDGGGLVLLDFALIVEVVLVADEEEVDFGDVGLLVDLLDPEVDHFEGLVVGDVEDEEYAIDVAVVVGGDGVVAGGAGGVPDLHADGVAVLEFEDLLLVLDADGGRVVHAELLVYVLRQQRALTHVALPDDQHLHPHLVLAHTPIIYIETPHSSGFKKYTPKDHYFRQSPSEYSIYADTLPLRQIKDSLEHV